MYPADDTTAAMASFAIEGNVIDHAWPHIVTTTSGRPDTQAIMLLAHIVYWYRPSYQPQPDGSFLLMKKYKSDLLQRSYSHLENMLGLTKRQAQEAFDTLERLGFASRELRTLEISGQRVSNILFIRLHHEKLSQAREEFFKKCIPSYENSYDPPTKLSLAPDKNVTTYTESTTQTSTKKQQQQGAPPPAPPAVVAFPKEKSLGAQARPPDRPPAPVASPHAMKKQQQQQPPAAPAPQPKPPKPAIYACLEEIDMPTADKIEITSRHDEQWVKNAVEWATHPETKLNKGMAPAIKWACQNKPQVPKIAIDIEAENRTYASRYDYTKNQFARVDVCPSYVAIIPNANCEPRTVKYGEKGFKELFHSALRKYGFKILE